MGIELKDMRARITPETDAVLEGLSRAHGRGRQEIVRDVLHEWALKQIHAASVMHRLLLAEGLRGIDGGAGGNAGGTPGNVRECEGTRGSGTR